MQPDYFKVTVTDAFNRYDQLYESKKPQLTPFSSWDTDMAGWCHQNRNRLCVQNVKLGAKCIGIYFIE